MQNILNDLYYGQISPWERRPRQMGELRDISRKLENERLFFIEKMSPEDCERFEELEGLYAQSNSLELADTFACGFRLGAQLTAAVFAEENT